MAAANEWKALGTIKDYTVWNDGEAYQVTKGDEPRNAAGYHDLDALLRLKGLDAADLVASSDYGLRP